MSSENTLKNLLVQKDSVKNENSKIEEMLTVQQDNKKNHLQDGDTECKNDIFLEINIESSDDDNVIQKRKIIKKCKAKVPVCQKCDISFKSMEELKEHKKTKEHLKHKTGVCKYCNKTMLSFYLLEHYRRVHTDEKPFQCHICSVRFNGKSDLIQHIQIHTGEKPHKCDVCEKG